MTGPSRTPPDSQAFGLLTPPNSPQKTLVQGSHASSVASDLTSSPDTRARSAHFLARKNNRSHGTDTYRSPGKDLLPQLDLALLTPPTTPVRKATINSRLVFQSTDENGHAFNSQLSFAAQSLDGVQDDIQRLSFSSIEGDNDERLAPPSSIRHRTTKVDLASPNDSSVPRPLSPGPDTPTPLVRASPAKAEFPFPRELRKPSILSPLAVRASRPRSFSAQSIRSPGLVPRTRRLSAGVDRFIPERRPIDDSTENYRLSKSPEQLNASERLLRRQQGTLDPFRQRPRRTIPLPLATSVNVRAVTNRRTANTVLSVRRPQADTTRQVSNAAVWGIGAIARLGNSVEGVHDGYGGLLGRGTNAPLYSSQFLARNDKSWEMELHERRLALAFEIDQSSRMLHPPASPESPAPGTSSPSSPHSPARLPSSSAREPVTWRDNEWTRPGSVSSIPPTLPCCELS